MRTLAPRTVLFALSTLAVGCVLNVEPVSGSVTSDSGSTISTLRADLRAIGLGLDEVEVLGTDRTSGHAEITVGGLLANGGSQQSLEDGVAFGWDASLSPLVALSVGYRGPSPESVWFEGLKIELPRACDVDLQTEHASVTVREIAANVRVRTVGGPITVEGVSAADLASEHGDIEVSAASAIVQTDAADVVLHVSGHLEVETRSGSVSGTIEGGGTITCGSGGPIRVTLAGPLTEDLELTTVDGDIELHVPADAALELSLSTTGRIHVAVGDVSFDGVGTVERRLGAGGRRLVAHADAGSIRIVSGL